MNKITGTVLAICCLLGTSSCSFHLLGRKKHKKQTTDSTVITTPPQVSADTAYHGTAGITPVMTGAPVPTPTEVAKLIADLQPLWQQRLDYRTFSGKAKVNFDGPKGSVGFSANFRIAKDSLIWVHITALGGLYPVARIMVTTDSFFMINYDQKEATRVAISNAAHVLPVAVSFTQLEHLFTGEPLAGGTIIYAETKDAGWAISTEDSDYIQHITYERSDSAMTFSDLETHSPTGPHAMTHYGDFSVIDNRKLSTSRNVNIQNGVNTYTLDMNLVNLEFDKGLEFPFSIPGNYKVKNK